MYKVYIENNVILFVEQEPTDPENEALRMHINLNDTFSITKLLQKLQFTKKLYLISDDSSALFEQFCSSLRFIEAGGGWVTDRSNRILMIFRNGKWDLPKGKREVGEAIETCAVREVSEECALAQQDLKCGELLTQTFHCYQMHGEWTEQEEPNYVSLRSYIDRILMEESNSSVQCISICVSAASEIVMEPAGVS